MHQFSLKLTLSLTLTLCWLALLGQASDGIVITKHNIGPYAQANSTQTVWAVIENFSAEVLTEFDIYIQVDEGSIYCQSFTNLELGNWEPFLFNITTPIGFSKAAETKVKLWLNGINGVQYDDVDTLTVAVSVLSTTSSRMVLYESFSSSNCISCANVNPYIRELGEQHKGEMFIIGYQTDCYSSNPMCMLASEYINERINFYGITSTPRSVVLPWYTGISTSFNSDFIIAELQRPAPISIEGSFEISTNEVDVSFTLNPHTPIDLNKVELKVAFTEDIVTFTEPPGGNGETTFYHVLRRFKTFDGNDIKDLANGNSVSISFTEVFSDIISDVNLNAFRIGLFLQNTETFEIIQAAELSKVASGIEIQSITDLRIFPNPANEQISLIFTPQSAAAYTISITNSLGQSVFTKKYSAKPFEQISATIPTQHLPMGIYFVSVKNANEHSTAKLIVH